jgi:hypothetical protein
VRSEVLRLHTRRLCLLASAAVCVMASRLGLLLLPFSSVQRMASPAVRTREAATDVDSLAWAVCCVANRLPGTACLPRAMALNVLLRRWGIASELQFGIGRDTGGRLRAHAWVTVKGRPVVEEDLTGYAPLTRAQIDARAPDDIRLEPV